MNYMHGVKMPRLKTYMKKYFCFALKTDLKMELL